MTILISPTAFKGTLSPWEATKIISRVVKRHFPSVPVIEQPLADGGDGTLEIMIQRFGGSVKSSVVIGPQGQKVRAKWAILKTDAAAPGKTAIIEMAEASGIKLLKGRNRIRTATSRGTGQLMKHAIDQGCRHILLGVGGTACSDGGAGALSALGFRFLDRAGNQLDPTPASLAIMTAVVWPSNKKHLKNRNISVLCDVKNPLLGTHGSARTFGPQKGANAADIEFLEAFLKKFSSFAFCQTRNDPGSGAAGGIAFGLSAFAGARLVKGARSLMDLLGWKNLAKTSSLIITGEGKMDKTSFSGKVIGEIVANKYQNRVAVVCGSTSLTKNQLERRGLSAVACMGSQGLKNPKQALEKTTLLLLKQSRYYL